MAGPISYVRGSGVRSKTTGLIGSRTTVGKGGLWSFEIDQKQLDAIERKLRRASGKPLAERTRKELYIQGDIIAKRAKQLAPRGPSGNLRKSIKVRGEKERGALSALYHAQVGGGRNGVLVGPVHKVAPHRHLVISGTGYRSVTRPGRASSPWRAFYGKAFRTSSLHTTGRMTPNPFMDRAKAGAGPQASKAIATAWMRLYRTGR